MRRLKGEPMHSPPHKPMFRRADGLLVLGVLLLSGLVWAVLGIQSGQTPAAQVVVEVNGAFYQRQPLERAGQIVVQQGEALNVVIVDHGQVSMHEANCPGEQCVQQGAISRVGSSIICLPHRVVVRIEGVREEGLDAVVR